MSPPSPRWRPPRSTMSRARPPRRASRPRASSSTIPPSRRAMSSASPPSASCRSSAKIALGSLRNKLLILLPAALILSYFLPWAITPLLMFGGAYLCYEGVEKVFEAVVPHHAHAHEAELGSVALESAVARGREGRGRHQDRFHPLGRDHGDHAGGGSLFDDLDPGGGAGGGRHRHHGRRLWRGGADREGRRRRRGARQQRQGHGDGRARAAASGARWSTACRAS